mmetsp:Transcript_31276/g.36696  ORF Transcript_31276/g.36696 Transcript_31276/m.36696 type:complete len:224 (-) Transcript_31276:84-755(-)
MFSSFLEIFPYYFAWVMAVILLVNRSYGRPCLACTVALVGAFEFGAKVYYGDPRLEPLINAALTFFPSNYTLGEALKVLRYGMPIILQGALLTMDSSFDSIGNEPENPTIILENICSKQQYLLTRGDDIMRGFKTRSKDENAALLETFYDEILSFNKVELATGIAESLDTDEKKTSEQSIFVKIFKMIMSISLLMAFLNYILFGPEGFKIPKYQNMQTASAKK